MAPKIKKTRSAADNAKRRQRKQDNKKSEESTREALKKAAQKRKEEKAEHVQQAWREQQLGRMPQSRIKVASTEPELEPGIGRDAAVADEYS